MAWVDLTAEQKAVVTDYVRNLRAWCGEQARVNNHGASSIADDVRIVCQASSFDAFEEHLSTSASSSCRSTSLASESACTAVRLPSFPAVGPLVQLHHEQRARRCRQDA